MTEDLLVGRVIATKFAIESVIGSGAMGVVYRARHIALDKPVAVKVLHQAFATDERFAARLRLEAKAASRLDHPNSVRVIDFGEEPDGLLYIAMELLDGLDLFQTLERSWPIPESRAVDLLCQALSALAVAHDMGIVHRDLKPENIMLLTRVDDDGRPRDIVKVCDFGIAKTADPSEDAGTSSGRRALTTQGMIIGTPEYMSPEQCRGQPLDARSDLYSVGVILYQILAGRVPFQAASPIDVVLKHISEEPAPPSTIRPGLSPKLEQVCLRALRKTPAERYSSAREMRAELRGIAGLDAVPDLSPQSPSVRLIVSKTAETLLSAVSVPSVETSGKLAPDVPRVRVENEVAPRARGRMRYAVLIAIPAVVVAAVAIGSQRSPNLAPSANLAAPSAHRDSPVPQALPPSEVVSAEPPAPSSPAPHPSKPIVVAQRPRAVVRSTSAGPAQPTAVADSESEPRVPPPPAPIVSPTPSSPPDGNATVTAPAVRSTSLPSPAVDPSKGRVAWNVSAASGGPTAGNVARALVRPSSAWQRCYQAGLQARPTVVEGTATLRLTCDQQGRVVDVTYTGLNLPDVAACIRAASQGVTIPNADTGEAWASIALTFRVAE